MKVFVDSNVIVYARDRAAAAKRVAAIEWLRALAAQDAAVISPQVLNESIRAFISKMNAASAELQTFVTEMTPWCTASVAPAVIERAIDSRPERRYPNADALAADLRIENVDAFTADLRVLTRRPGLGALPAEATAA